MSKNLLQSPLFDLKDVSFAYGTSPVLQDVNLTLQPGCFYGVIGPNGCGKTTLLDLLTGCKQQRTGNIRYKGKELHSYTKKELARQLALVPQEFDTGFGFTVEEIVLMGRHPHIDRFSAPSKQDWQLVDQALECIGISDLRDRYTNNLSGGQKQRAVVARALAQNAPVLLFDEATSSLDVKYTLQIFNIARQLVHTEGRTVIAVIHNLNLAAAYCDQIIFMKDGKISRQGPTSETMTTETIAEVFDVQAKVALDPFNNTQQVSFQYWEQ
jgi:iron complex transport system ATP-binding protein